MQNDNTKKLVVLVCDKKTKTSQEKPLEEVKQQVEETKTIPIGIFTGAALTEIIMDVTSIK